MALADPQPDYTELLNFLTTEEQSANDSTLNEQRATALDFYTGQPYGDEQEGRSQLVTREVAQTVDYDVISILRTIVSSDRIVQFEARNEEQAGAADDASELIHFSFMREQDGYRILHDAIKLGELEKTGVIKSWVEHRQKPMTVEVPAEAFQPDDDGNAHIDGMRVISAEHINPDEVADDGFGNVVPAPEIHRATVIQKLPPRFRDAAVPNEEFGASADTFELDESPYLFHAQRKSLSDLQKMGFQFDPDTLWANEIQARVIADARDRDQSRKAIDTTRRGAMRQVWYREEFVLFDLNGDGIAERLIVQRVGRTVLNVEEVDEQPFTEWCPYPMPGRRVGQSLFDKCGDVQRVNSVLLRQAMDSLYQSTNPRTLLHEDSVSENTIDDLLTVRSGALIRWQGAQAPTPWATIPVHDQAFQGIEMMTNMLESRTGVTRLNQGLDVDTFDRTASGTAAIMAAGESMQEYRARNFVEMLRRLFAKKYRMMRQYGQPVTIQVDGEFREIDPRKWPEEIDIRVRVGLGTGNQDKRIAYLSQTLESQIEGLQQSSPLVTWKNAFNTSRALISSMNIGNPSDYVTDPDKNQQQQGDKPDPETIKAQGEAQAASLKVQSEHEQAMARLSLQQQESQAAAALKAQANEQDLAAKREKTALDIELARERAAFEADLANRQQGFEMDLAERRFQFDQEIARKKAEQASQSDDNITNYRPGGALDQ